MEIATEHDLRREMNRLALALMTATARANTKIADAEARLNEESAPHIELRQRAAELVEGLRVKHDRAKAAAEEALVSGNAKALVAAVSEERATETALGLARAHLDRIAEEGKGLYGGRVNAIAARRRTVSRLAGEIKEAIRELPQYDDGRREALAGRIEESLGTLNA